MKFDHALAVSVCLLRSAVKIEDLFARIELHVLYRSVGVSALNPGREILVAFRMASFNVVKDARARFVIRLCDKREIADSFHARPKIGEVNGLQQSVKEGMGVPQQVSLFDPAQMSRFLHLAQKP